MENSVPTSLRITLSIGIFISLLFYNPYLLDAALLSKWTALSITLLLVTFLLAVSKTGSQLNAINSNFRIVAGLFAAFLIFRIVGIFYSINPTDALFELSKEILFFIMLMLLTAVYKGREDFLKSVKIPFLIFIGISLSITMYQFIPLAINNTYDAQSSYLVTSIFAHRNMLAHIMVLTLPFLFIYEEKLTSNKWMIWSIMALNLLILYFLYCRTAWVAMAAGSILCLIYYVFNGKERDSFLSILKKRLKWIVGLGLALIAFILFDIDEFTKQWHSLSHWHYGSVYNRLRLWEATVLMVQEFPIVGAGTGSWKIEILQFISSSDITKGGFTFYQRPHNDFLWIWSESGLIPFLIYLFLFLFVVFKSFRQGFSRVSLASVFGITAYVFIACLSFPKERMEHQVWLSFYAFLILSERNPSVQLKVKFTRIYSWLSLLLLVGIIVLLTFRNRGEYFTVKAFSLKPESYSKKIELLNRAESSFYKMDATSTPLTYHRALFRLNLGENEQAEADFREALSLNPNHPHILNYYASVKYGKGEVDEAKELYQRIIELKPDHNDALINLAVISTRNDEIEKALQFLSNADIENVTNQHKEVILAILKLKMKNLQESSEDPEYIQEIQQMRFNNPWIYEMYEKSIIDKRSFENQIELDVRYLIEK